ncbi:hypothetical protein OG21DRAFT_1521132 [Imleria badia]|nr:hypothetical protein OG21DRAFT_1521132 [Imleria badia]
MTLYRKVPFDIEAPYAQPQGFPVSTLGLRSPDSVSRESPQIPVATSLDTLRYIQFTEKEKHIAPRSWRLGSTRKKAMMPPNPPMSCWFATEEHPRAIAKLRMTLNEYLMQVTLSMKSLRCCRATLHALRLPDPHDTATAEQKTAVCITSNYPSSRLKIESASMDTTWHGGNYNNQTLTSMRNRDLIKTKDQEPRLLHPQALLLVDGPVLLHHRLCKTVAYISGQDLQDMSRSVMKVHHLTSVRSLVFSPSLWHPQQGVVGLNNGSIYRWDLQMGQCGHLVRFPVTYDICSILPVVLNCHGTSITSKSMGNIPSQTE